MCVHPLNIVKINNIIFYLQRLYNDLRLRIQLQTAVEGEARQIIRDCICNDDTAHQKRT
jgi:hypothetical protein